MTIWLLRALDFLCFHIFLITTKKKTSLKKIQTRLYDWVHHKIIRRSGSHFLTVLGP